MLTKKNSLTLQYKITQELEEQSISFTYYFNIAVWLLITFYVLFYSYLGFYSAAAALSLGVFFINPLIHYLLKTHRTSFARVLFLLSGSLYVYLTGIVFTEATGTYYYYIPAIIVSSLIFGQSSLGYRILGVFIPCLFWFLQEFLSNAWIPSQFIYKVPFDTDYLKRVHFIGTTLLSIYFVQIFTKKLMHLSSKIILEEKKSTEKVQAALDGANLGAWEWDITQNTVTFDKRLHEILGLTYATPTRSALDWYPLIHPEDQKFVSRKMAAHLEGKTPYYENIQRIKHTSGHWVWVLDHGRVTERDEQQRPLRASGTYLDITNLKSIEQKLEETQKIARLGSWTYDITTEAFRFSKIINLLDDRFTSDTPLSIQEHLFLIHSEDQQFWHSSLQKCIKTLEPYHITFRVLTTTNEIKWIEARGQAVQSEENKVIAVEGTYQDITERVLQEEESELIADVLNIGVWKFYPKTQRLDWNPSMFRLFDVHPDEFTNTYQAWENTLTPDSKEKAVSELQQALEGKQEFDTFFSIHLKNGAKRYIGGRGKVIRNAQGEALIMYGINWDRTQEITLNQQLELERAKSIHTAKLAALGEMATSISHEINNPLTIIAGNIALIEKSLHHPEKTIGKLETVKKSIDRINRIVSSMRKFSRTTYHKNLVPLLLTPLIQEVLVLSEARLKNSKINLLLDLQSQHHVFGDELDLEQVFLNLIANAIDAATTGAPAKGPQPAPWVKIKTYDNAQNGVVVQISDSGDGVLQELSQKIFEPFFTTKSVGEGTGLGLSITKGILDHHHASFELTSLGPKSNPKNDPTCFEIKFLPLDQDPHPIP